MTKEIENRWAALAAQFPPSRPNTSTNVDDGVHPGQLREAIWGEFEATVLVIDVDDARAEVTVNPVSLEPGVADERTLVLGAESVPLRGGVAIWPTVAVTMSFAVLDGLVAELPERAMHMVKRSFSAVQRASGHRDGTGPRFGADPLPGSGAARAIDDLLDSVDALCAVRPRVHSQSPTRSRAEFPLKLGELITTLNITQSEAMSIISGKRHLPPDKLEIVARAAGVSVAEVSAASLPLPDDLERELLEPRWRAVIRQHARMGNEAEAREELGRNAFALAARSTGRGRELWRQRIQAVLETSRYEPW